MLPTVGSKLPPTEELAVCSSELARDSSCSLLSTVEVRQANFDKNHLKINFLRALHESSLYRSLRSDCVPGVLKATRFGYNFKVGGHGSSEAKGFRTLAAWRSATRRGLVQGRSETEQGLVGAGLGGSLYKKRVARPGGGKRGGYRTLLAFRARDRYVFLHGFSKNDRDNITEDERRALQFAGRVFLDLGAVDLAKALNSSVLVEVRCEEQYH